MEYWSFVWHTLGQLLLVSVALKLKLLHFLLTLTVNVEDTILHPLNLTLFLGKGKTEASEPTGGWHAFLSLICSKFLLERDFNLLHSFPNVLAVVYKVSWTYVFLLVTDRTLLTFWVFSLYINIFSGDLKFSVSLNSNHPGFWNIPNRIF
jgi:hypothetical protein